MEEGTVGRDAESSKGLWSRSLSQLQKLPFRGAGEQRGRCATEEGERRSCNILKTPDLPQNFLLWFKWGDREVGRPLQRKDTLLPWPGYGGQGPGQRQSTIGTGAVCLLVPTELFFLLSMKIWSSFFKERQGKEGGGRERDIEGEKGREREGGLGREGEYYDLALTSSPLLFHVLL